jgi:hypothetical protein
MKILTLDFTCCNKGPLVLFIHVHCNSNVLEVKRLGDFALSLTLNGNNIYLT